jgi:multidrug resistance efflux pump
MDNMREDSIAYVQAWAKKYLLFSDIDLPVVSRKHRRIYLVFGIAAFFYSLFVLLIVLGWARNAFVKWFGDTWGYLATGVVLYLMLRKRIRGALPTMHSAWQSTKETLMSWKSSGVKIAAAAILLIAIIAWPGPTKVSSDFVLEPIRRAEVHATVPGWVSSVPVKDGQLVQPGAILAVLKNPDLDARAAVVSEQMAMAEGTSRAARATGKQQEAAEQSAKAQTLNTELNSIRVAQAALVIRAPFAGFIASPEIEQRIGDYIERGETFLTLADRSQMKARILVRDWEIADVHVGEAAKLNVLAYPFTSYAGSVQRIMPAAAADIPVGETKLVRFGQETTNFIGVVLDFPNPDGALHEGYTGTAKIYGPTHSLGWRTGRSIYRWMRSLIW